MTSDFEDSTRQNLDILLAKISSPPPKACLALSVTLTAICSTHRHPSAIELMNLFANSIVNTIKLNKYTSNLSFISYTQAK